MRIFYGGQSADVDLVECEKGDRCGYDHTCRIHQLYAFLKRAGLISEYTSLDLPSSDAYRIAIEKAENAAHARALQLFERGTQARAVSYAHSAGYGSGSTESVGHALARGVRLPRECEFGRMD